MHKSISEGDKLLFKMCDRDGCTSDDLTNFHKIPIVKLNRRISFGVMALPDPYHIQVPSGLCESPAQVIDGLSLYRKRYKIFDFKAWVKSGKIKPNDLLKKVTAIQ
jgi:hypothetical protein